MDDDEATIIMVDANLQREAILPSEKAWAYRYKLEAVKAQGKRNDLTSGRIVMKLKEARKIVAGESGEHYKQVSRYIRLTHLVSQLIEKIDEKKLVLSLLLNYLILKNKNKNGYILI